MQMKLFVQGRKDGYKVLYPKPTPPEFFQFAGDLRPDGSSNNLLLGKFFYTLAFASGGQIFTKQLIIQDVQRQGLGNIGFSLFISNNKKLPGIQVIELLDELVQTYITKYCPDYFLDFVQEDWSIFENIVKNYSHKLRDVVHAGENYPTGGEDPAHIYYSDNLELERYFDAPAQEEYTRFKQVFFIDKSLENRLENPLKSIRHHPNGNLTGKIDLNNQSYKLIYSTLTQGGVRLEVKVNGVPLMNKKVRRNDPLEITWSKTYHDAVVKKGTCVEIGSPYLLINEDSKTITIKDIALNEKTFKFQVKAQDKFSRPILDAELFAFSSITKRKRNLVDNSIILREEELNENYFIKGIKGNLESEAKELSKLSANQEITITLLETVRLKIRVFDSRDRNKFLGDARITVSNKSVRPTDDFIEFRGDEVTRTWQITVSHPDYKSKTLSFSPATDQKDLMVELEELPAAARGSLSERRSYQLKIDERKGKNTWKGEPLELTGRQLPEDLGCDAKYGYKFSGWELMGKRGDCEYYQASFEELWYRKVPKVVWGILPIFIAVGAYFLLKDFWEPKPLTDREKIEKYLAGNEMKLDSLNSLKKICKNDSTKDSTFLSKNKDLCSKLDNAIAFRRYLDNGNLDSLIKHGSSLISYPKQKEIKTKIDSLLLAQDNDTSSIRKISWEVKDLTLDDVGKQLDKRIADIKNSSETTSGDGASSNEGQQEDTDNKNPSTDKQKDQKNTSTGKNDSNGKDQTTLNKEFNDKLNSYLSMAEFPKLIVWKNFLNETIDQKNKEKIQYIIDNLQNIKDLDPKDRKDLESIKKNL
jgi:hypothetical protein